jgi:uncharacterized protein YbjT (DUF2867 family)
MYAVTGVSGNTGAIVARELLERGEKVRVIVRDEAKGASWKAKGAEVAVASVDDVEALTRALSGVDGAYLISPPDPSLNDAEGRGRQLGANYVEAVRKSGVKHVVFLSSIGGQHESGTGPILTLHHIENSLRAAGVNATFLRPTYFIENWAMGLGSAKEQGVLPSFLPAAMKFPMVATRDIGRIAADALLNPAAGIRIINIAGPQEYSPADVASQLGSVLGRDVTVGEGPLDAVVPTFTSFGISDHMAHRYRDMYDGLIRGHVAWNDEGETVRGTVTPAEVFRGILGN